MQNLIDHNFRDHLGLHWEGHGPSTAPDRENSTKKPQPLIRPQPTPAIYQLSSVGQAIPPKSRYFLWKNGDFPLRLFGRPREIIYVKYLSTEPSIEQLKESEPQQKVTL